MISCIHKARQPHERQPLCFLWKIQDQYGVQYCSKDLAGTRSKRTEPSGRQLPTGITFTDNKKKPYLVRKKRHGVFFIDVTFETLDAAIDALKKREAEIRVSLSFVCSYVSVLHEEVVTCSPFEGRCSTADNTTPVQVQEQSGQLHSPTPRAVRRA